MSVMLCSFNCNSVSTLLEVDAMSERKPALRITQSVPFAVDEVVEILRGVRISQAWLQ
jgi:hypothetical protein